MNIKEHIEAGHYERDERFGAWTVTLRNGTTARVFTASNGGQFPLVGVVSISGRGWTPIQWTAAGCPEADTSHWSIQCDIRPPSPRKVKVTRWAVMYTPLSKNKCHSTFDSEADACREQGHFNPGVTTVVPLTGEYEEPWS